MKLPCRDCITMPICRSLVLELYNNEEFKMVSFLCNRCEIYQDYAIDGMNNDNLDPRAMKTHSFFKGIK